MGHGRVRHAAARDAHALSARGGRRPPGRTHAGDPAADRAVASQRHGAAGSGRADNHARLRRDRGRRRHALRRDHGGVRLPGHGPGKADASEGDPALASARDRRRDVGRDLRRPGRPRPRLRGRLRGGRGLQRRRHRLRRLRRDPGHRGAPPLHASSSSSISSTSPARASPPSRRSRKRPSLPTGPTSTGTEDPARRPRREQILRFAQDDRAVPAPVAAREVSRAKRGRSLAPRERSACAGSGERSRPHPAEPLAGAPAGRRSRAQPERRYNRRLS